MQQPTDQFVTVGRISGVFGLRGWVKVFSDTDPRDHIVQFDPWYVRIGGQWREMRIADGHAQGKGVVALLDGIDDRDAASALVGADIAVRREQLPELAQGEYYWSDLIGLNVVTVDGVELGTVDRLMETGANDVLVVKGERERLIPYLPGQVITEVDLDNGLLRVDWDPEF